MNILQSIGNTPVFNLSSFSTKRRVKLFAKIEGFNPSGSIKDRIAKRMIETAVKNKQLSKNKIIVEATSGNTGIALAMISALKGYKFNAVMPESASIERRRLLKAYGADIILTNGKLGTNHSLKVAQDIVNSDPEKYIMLNQYKNLSNSEAHFFTTGKEIIEDVPGLTHFVAGIGTGGTVSGVAKRLKQFNSEIRVIAVEPLVNTAIEGLRNMTEYSPPVFIKDFVDETLNLGQKELVFDLMRKLSTEMGIFVGPSSGAALWGAIQTSKQIEEGIIVTVFPDRGDRYLSVRF